MSTRISKHRRFLTRPHTVAYHQQQSARASCLMPTHASTYPRAHTHIRRSLPYQHAHTRVHSHTQSVSGSEYTQFLSTLKRIYREEGLARLYSGVYTWLANVRSLRSSPWTQRPNLVQKNMHANDESHHPDVFSSCVFHRHPTPPPSFVMRFSGVYPKTVRYNVFSVLFGSVTYSRKRTHPDAHDPTARSSSAHIPHINTQEWCRAQCGSPLAGSSSSAPTRRPRDS